LISVDTTTDDVLDRRLNYVLTTINIAGALLGIAATIMVIDEVTGHSLRQRWERFCEQIREERRQRLEYDTAVKRLQFEAWLALQEETND